MILTAFVILLLLSGCTKVKNSQKPDFNAFEMTADIKYNGMDIEAKIARKALNLYTVELLSPKELKGMTIDYDGEELKFKYLGITFNTYPAALPDQSFLKGMFSVFNEVSVNDKLSFKSKSGQIIIGGATDYGDFEVITDENGNLKSISIKDLDFTTIIKEYKKPTD